MAGWIASMLKGFKDFLLRGNIVELAVAVVIGTAFTALVAAFTTSFLEPLIGLIGGGGVEGGIATVNGQQFTWGAFINAVITFVLTFSGLVLSEAILSWLGLGIDGSWGQMIDQARDELSRDPIIWWNLTAASCALFGLIALRATAVDGPRRRSR